MPQTTNALLQHLKGEVRGCLFPLQGELGSLGQLVGLPGTTYHRGAAADRARRKSEEAAPDHPLWSQGCRHNHTRTTLSSQLQVQKPSAFALSIQAAKRDQCSGGSHRMHRPYRLLLHSLVPDQPPLLQRLCIRLGDLSTLLHLGQELLGLIHDGLHL